MHDAQLGSWLQQFGNRKTQIRSRCFFQNGYPPSEPQASSNVVSANRSQFRSASENPEVRMSVQATVGRCFMRFFLTKFQYESKVLAPSSIPPSSSSSQSPAASSLTESNGSATRSRSNDSHAWTEKEGKSRQTVSAETFQSAVTEPLTTCHSFFSKSLSFSCISST